MSAFEITERPIEGAKFEEKATATQLGSEAFLAALDKVLALEGVKYVAWSQYTPYFNDGDACEFSVHAVAVALDESFHGDDLDEDNLEGLYGSAWEEPLFGEYDLYEYLASNYNNKKFELNGKPTKAIYDGLREFEGLLQSSFEYLVKANFGDHAQVRADADGFSVSEYEHD